MKRVRRWLFTGIAAASLLLGVSTAVVWIRSYWVKDTFAWGDSGNPTVGDTHGPWTDGHWIVCSLGGLEIDREYFAYPLGATLHLPSRHYSMHKEGKPNGYPYLNFSGARPAWDKQMIGFEFAYLNRTDNRIQSVTFPLAIIFVAALVLLVLWTRQEVMRRRRSRIGFCPKCGYDLRATPDRCPECGAAAQQNDPQTKIKEGRGGHPVG